MIFITGATGLLGSQVLVDLIEKQNAVKVLVRVKSSKELIYQRLKNKNIPVDKFNSLVDWIEGDLDDILFLEDALKGVKQIFHCAGFVSFSPEDKKMLDSINYKGTRNLVNAALENKVEKFGFVSSIATLGRATSGSMITEETKWEATNNNSFYAKSKYKAEMEVWRGVAEGMNAVIINPSIILGEGNWEKGSSALFNTVLKGNKFYTFGVNGFVDVQDVSNALILLMESEIKNERFVVSAENVIYKDLFAMMAKHLKVEAPKYYAYPLLSQIVWRILAVISFFTRRKPLITRATARTAKNKYYYNTEKLEKAINFKYQPIEKTIERISISFLKEKER
ncbi:MAG: NAD-dependent epimerase/dehydratase family protein [Bacteroidota bacterium]